ARARDQIAGFGAELDVVHAVQAQRTDATLPVALRVGLAEPRAAAELLAGLEHVHAERARRAVPRCVSTRLPWGAGTFVDADAVAGAPQRAGLAGVAATLRRHQLARRLAARGPRGGAADGRARGGSAAGTGGGRGVRAGGRRTAATRAHVLSAG